MATAIATQLVIEELCPLGLCQTLDEKGLPGQQEAMQDFRAMLDRP